MADRAVEPLSSLYEMDFYAWTQQQAELLRRGSTSRAELENIAEEIETLGRKEISDLRSRYTILLLHLLKEVFQPQRATRRWKTTILEQRLRISRPMGNNPSLEIESRRDFRAGLRGCPRARRVGDRTRDRHVSGEFAIRPGQGVA